MPLLIDPAKPYSKNLAEWITHYFLVPTLWPSDHNTTHMLNNVVNGAFLVTYGFDGYDLTKNAYYNTESSEIIEYTSLTLDPWLALASFLGLPTRTDVVEEDANEQSQLTDTTQDSPLLVYDELLAQNVSVAPTKTSYPKISLTQFFLKNFMGGWQWSNVSTEKKITQIIGLLIKVPVIFPFKVLTIFLKLPLNIVKFFTEFLPLILTTLTIVAVIWLAEKVGEYSGGNYKKGSIKSGTEQPNKSWILPLAAFLLSPITIALALIHLAIRVFYITGRALTAPLHSMSIAFEYAQELKVPFVSQHTSQRIMYFVGGLFALVSLALSATLWALALPLLFGSVVVYLPKIAQLATTVLNWPFMAQLISNLSVVFTSVGGLLNGVFGALLTGSSGFLGVQLSTTFITAGLTLGAIVTIVATFLSLTADWLSDKWCTWHKGGFFTSLLLYAFPDSEDTSYTPLTDQTSEHGHGRSDTTSPTVQNTVSSTRISEGRAHEGLMGAEKFQNRAQGQEGPTTSHTARTQGSGHQNLDSSDCGPDGQPLAEL